MDASYKIQRGIHVHLIQFFMCPEFWVHIRIWLLFLRIFMYRNHVDREKKELTDPFQVEEIDRQKNEPEPLTKVQGGGYSKV